jgi:hypothetical protein
MLWNPWTSTKSYVLWAEWQRSVFGEFSFRTPSNLSCDFSHSVYPTLGPITWSMNSTVPDCCEYWDNRYISVVLQDLSEPWLSLFFPWLQPSHPLSCNTSVISCHQEAPSDPLVLMHRSSLWKDLVIGWLLLLRGILYKTQNLSSCLNQYFLSVLLLFVCSSSPKAFCTHFLHS